MSDSPLKQEITSTNGLPGLAVRRPVTMLMVFSSLLVLGAVAWHGISLQLLPEGFDPPFLYVWLSYPNSSPVENMERICKPVEEALVLLEAMQLEDEDLVLNGGSAIIGPDTTFLAGPVFDQPCIVYAEIESERVSEGHLVIDTDGHYARPDVFHLEVNVQPQLNVSFGSQRK